MFFFNKETLEDYISYKLLSVDTLTWRCLRVPSSCSMVCEIKIPFTLCVSFNDFLPVASRAFNFFDLSEIVERFPICLKKVDLKEKFRKAGLIDLILALDPLFLSGRLMSGSEVVPGPHFLIDFLRTGSG